MSDLGLHCLSMSHKKDAMLIKGHLLSIVLYDSNESLPVVKRHHNRGTCHEIVICNDYEINVRK